MKKETIVGLAGLAFVLFIVVSVLAVRQHSQFRLLIQFADGAGGVEVGDDVVILGHKAGEVIGIDHHSHHTIGLRG